MQYLANYFRDKCNYLFIKRAQNLQLEVTRLDILDEVIAEVKLKMLLWESTDTWAKTIEEWYTCDFSELNPEDMNLFTAKTIKNVTQLEKGIPKNLIVPKLRDQVELLKDKVKFCKNYAKYSFILLSCLMF